MDVPDRGPRRTLWLDDTARAHERGRTHDWVVACFCDDDHREGQCRDGHGSSGAAQRRLA